MQTETQAVGELQPERRHLVVEPEVFRLGQKPRDLIRPHAGPNRVDRPVHPLPGLLVSITLALRGAADTESAVVAGPIAVVGVDDVEERLITRTDDAVGEVVRVWVAPFTGDRVDCLDLIRTHLVEPFVGQGHDLVLPHAGAQRVHDVLVHPVDHGRGLIEQHDLVGGLDHPRVEHALLGVDHGQPLTLHLEQERRLHDVHPHRGAGQTRVSQDALDLGDRIAHQTRIRCHRAAEPEEPGPPVLLRQPR